MSVSLICSVTNRIVSRALSSIARLGAIRKAGVSSVHARTAVIGTQGRRRAAVAFSLLSKVRSLACMKGMLSGAHGVSYPRRSAVHPVTIAPQIWIACQDVPPFRFGLFKFTPMQPPFSSIEPYGQS
ncbi:hypothetical protein [Bradyrhizobium sp. Ghvi]|uniref:hypothetical protein n=1 Tax=Bradyrhizobium sp. Ghvi TaxID=1855319 RepID=UPI0011781376|nr:hypothetical protein [Bradyrhizobium sp. Ghvi]